jgi:6-phosphogluconolactonase
MLQKALVLFFVLANLALCIGCGTTANHYVYASLPETNQIIAFREDPNSGYLTEIAGSPYAAGTGVNFLVLHPSGKFLYASNFGLSGENDISLFGIASDGVLTEEFPRTPVTPNASQPTLLAMDPGGNYLYVGNILSDNISVFSIDSGTGALTEVPNSPFFIGFPPKNMKLTPSGNYLYVAAVGSPYGFIEGFSITAGILQSIGQFYTEDPNPDGLAIDPTGTYLYVSNSGSSNSISVFAIGQTGLLSQVQGSPINDNYTSPISLTLDPSGSYLYVANEGSANVGVYSISSSTGVPAILTTSATTGAFSTQSEPSFVVSDPSGKYLFVGNQGTSATIEPFVVSSGNLTGLTNYGVGTTPSSIVVLGK